MCFLMRMRWAGSLVEGARKVFFLSFCLLYPLTYIFTGRFLYEDVPLEVYYNRHLSTSFQGMRADDSRFRMHRGGFVSDLVVR